MVIYTDAPFEQDRGKIAAVCLNQHRNLSLARQGYPPFLNRVYSRSAPERVISLFRIPSVIFGLELTAAVLVISEERFNLANKTVTMFIDNGAVLGALVNGHTPGMNAHNMISAIRFLLANF